MKVIIAGSRSLMGLELIYDAVFSAGFKITEVVEGEAPGVDWLARRWAEANGFPVRPFPADWDDLAHPDAIIRTNRYGKKYDARAGHRRNGVMADYADVLIAIWKDESGGTENMLEQMWRRKKPFHLSILKDDNPVFTVGELLWLQRSDESKQWLTTTINSN